MNIKAEISKIAEELVAADYIYDPEHKKQPQGGNWIKTDKGWSKSDGGKGQITQMKPQAPDKKTAPKSEVPPKTQKVESLFKQTMKLQKDPNFIHVVQLVRSSKARNTVTDEGSILDFIKGGGFNRFSVADKEALYNFALSKRDWLNEEVKIGNSNSTTLNKIDVLNKILKYFPSKDVAAPSSQNNGQGEKTTKDTPADKDTYDKLIEIKKSPEFESFLTTIRRNTVPGGIIDEAQIIKVLSDSSVLESLRPEEKKVVSDFMTTKKSLWEEDVKKDPKMKEISDAFTAKMDKIINLVNPQKPSTTKAPDPSQVVSRLFREPDMISAADKPKVLKSYKSWLLKNKDKTDEDTKGKVEDVRLAIKMLEGPRFKKVQPKLTGNMQILVRDNGIGDELQELAGFKETIKNHPQMSDKEYKQRVMDGMKLPRSQAQLKQAFVMNMNPMNYPSIEAFNAAKQRVQKMSVSDFGKLLASLNSDEEETV